MLKYTLVVVQGRPEGLKIPLKVEQFVIGRDPKCHLRPNSDLVSKLHCAFKLAEGRLYVKDAGSTNGTFVNEEKISSTKVELKVGDLVRVGPLTFEVQCVEEATEIAIPIAPAAGPKLADSAPPPVNPSAKTVVEAPKTIVLPPKLASAPPAIVAEAKIPAEAPAPPKPAPPKPAPPKPTPSKSAASSADPDDPLSWLIAGEQGELKDPNDESTVLDLPVYNAETKVDQPTAPSIGDPQEPGKKDAAPPPAAPAKDTRAVANDLLNRYFVRKRT